MSLAIFTSCASTKSIFKKEVKKRFEETAQSTRKITVEDLQKLPEPVANYLKYCGWLGKEIPRNFNLTFEGDFSLKEGKYVKVKAEQYNWVDKHPTRIFHIANPLFSARHCYDERGAFMLIKLFHWIKLVNAQGEIMDQSELVTYLNDLFILAPGALVEAPITWETIDDNKVKATITQYRHTVSAEISFNDKYELINFISYDRYASTDGKNAELLPWSTPMSDYKSFNGIKVPSYGEAVWHYSDREFPYAKFNVKAVDWNVDKH